MLSWKIRGGGEWAGIDAEHHFEWGNSNIFKYFDFFLILYAPKPRTSVIMPFFLNFPLLGKRSFPPFLPLDPPLGVWVSIHEGEKTIFVLVLNFVLIFIKLYHNLIHSWRKTKNNLCKGCTVTTVLSLVNHCDAI